MNHLSKVTLVTLIGFAILPVASPQPGASPKTFRESVYTAEQANRGAQIYSSKCSACHGENMAGLEMAPALAGANFRKTWDSQPLLVLATRIRTTMPPSAPQFSNGKSAYRPP